MNISISIKLKNRNKQLILINCVEIYKVNLINLTTILIIFTKILIFWDATLKIKCNLQYNLVNNWLSRNLMY